LPKYAAHEINPAERISCLMKSAVAADRLAGSLEELVAAARRFFAELAPHPVKLPLVAWFALLSFDYVLSSRRRLPMSLKPEPIPPVPEETARIARAAFPRGNVVIQMRDALGTIYTDDLFADLFPTHGQPAVAPWRLALVTMLQFMENLTDRQAADAVRRCLDWKYALSLDLTDTGFDHTVGSRVPGTPGGTQRRRAPAGYDAGAV
jgi:hypothetical protein